MYCFAFCKHDGRASKYSIPLISFGKDVFRVCTSIQMTTLIENEDVDEEVVAFFPAHPDIATFRVSPCGILRSPTVPSHSQSMPLAWDRHGVHHRKRIPGYQNRAIKIRHLTALGHHVLLR